jgi:hypothetical protein
MAASEAVERAIDSISAMGIRAVRSLRHTRFAAQSKLGLVLPVRIELTTSPLPRGNARERLRPNRGPFWRSAPGGVSISCPNRPFRPRAAAGAPGHRARTP